MKKTFLTLAIVAVVLVLVLAFWPRRYETTFFPMGGIPFKVIAYGKNYVEFDRIAGGVENVISDLEQTFNVHNKSSGISKLNADAAQFPFWASKYIDDMLILSRRWYDISDGAFDPTVGPLISLWENAGKRDELPTGQRIEDALLLVGLNKIKIADDGKISFAVRGMSLDFGAIAKGFIVDMAARTMTEHGVERGVVDAGGDIYAFGEGTFRFGIKDPVNKDAVMGILEVGQGAIVTSGDYERFIEIDGIKYPHILDPKTGMPVHNGIVSVTVVGGDAADADALATSVMVMGLSEGIALAREMGHVKLIIVRREVNDYRVYASSELSQMIEWNPNWENKVETF